MMMRMLSSLALLALLSNAPSMAGDGHDHGPAPVVSGPALPRFAASSDLFELVGIVNGKLLTVYLDRFADNVPVKGAQIEMELGAAKVALKEVAEGEFEATLGQALQPGVTPVTATIVAGKESDILAADIDIHAEPQAVPAAARGIQPTAAWVAGAAVALLAALWLGRRFRSARRAGGAA